MEKTNSKARAPRAGLRIVKVLRLLAFTAVVTVAFGLLVFRSAYANLKKQSLSMGRQLSQAGEVLNDQHRVLLNGEPIYVTNFNVPKTKQEVLDGIEKACVERSGNLGADYDKLPAAFKAGLDDNLRKRFSTGVVREEQGREGSVACVLQHGDGGIKALSEKLGRFAKSGDVADIGDFRYVYVRESARGTRVLTAWTEGSFRMKNMFPTEGEPAGSDPQNMPRPDDSKRIMSAEIEGAPYGVRVYESAQPAAAIFAQYERDMPTLGWDTLPKTPALEETTRAFSRPGVDVMVVAQENDGRTFVSLVESTMRTTATATTAP